MKAVVLLSGGLDSATVLYSAIASGDECYALSFNYQQRHQKELESAIAIAKSTGVIEHKIVSFDLRSWGGSALTDDKIDLPQERSLAQMYDLLQKLANS